MTNARPGKTWTYDSYTLGYKGLTRATFNAFKDAEKTWIQQRLSEILTHRKLAFTLAQEVEASGYFHKRMGRRTLTATIMSFLSGAATPGESYTTPEETWLKRIEDEAESKAFQVSLSKYRDGAVCWLLAKGHTYGKDFTSDTAIQVAENIAYVEEVARRTSVDEVIWWDFVGQNCDEPCQGWDGVSHRCECDNRRVTWVQGIGHTYDVPSVYAEAH